MLVESQVYCALGYVLSPAHDLLRLKHLRPVWTCDSLCLFWCSLTQSFSGERCMQPMGRWSSPPQLCTVRSPRLPRPLLLLLLLLSHFSRVRLCATPQTAAHQAPLSLGFSRQEHWSGLPFPSPMHESEK